MRKQKIPAERHFRLREIRGNRTLTDDAVASWWVLPGARWNFLSVAQQTAHLTAAQQAWAALAGVTACDKTRVHVRVTTVPYGIAEWAEDYHDTVRGRSTVPDPEAWKAHLLRDQAAMLDMSLAETKVFVGVDVAPRTLLGKLGAGETPRNRRAYAKADDAVKAALTMPGLDARPATGVETQRLVQRSVGLHLPEPAESALAQWVAPADMGSFTDPVRAELSASGESVKLTPASLRSDQPAEPRWVSVLTLGRMEPLTIPEKHAPWLAWLRLLPFEVEVSAHLEVLTGDQARGLIKRKLDLIRDQLEQYVDIGLRPPPNLARVTELATDVQDQMDTGDDVTSTRIHGPIRLAVSGSTEDECRDRAGDLIKHMARYQIKVEHPHKVGQQRTLLAEFVPGSRSLHHVHTRHMPLGYWAAAVPNLDAAVGTDAGPLFATTAGPQRYPVRLDVHHALYGDNELPGLMPIVGGLGSGKTTTAAFIAKNAAEAGAQCALMDPSGALSRLTFMPDLAPISQLVDLAGGQPGLLNPYGLIPMPDVNLDWKPEDWELEVATTIGERRSLAKDILRMMLPPAIAGKENTFAALTTAAAEADRRSVQDPTDQRSQPPSLSLVIDCLRECAEPELKTWSRIIADELSSLRDTRFGRLMFAPADREPMAGIGDARFLVLTMSGLQLPNLDADPNTWSEAQRMSVPLLHLTAFLIQARAFAGDRSKPKLNLYSEGHHLGRTSAGQMLLARDIREGRKFRSRALIDTQRPADVYALDGGTLSGECLVGRLEDPEDQAAACRLLRIDPGFAGRIGELSAAGVNGRGPRGFLFRDYLGRVEQVQVDLSHDRDLLLALTPSKPLPKAWLDAAAARSAA